MIVDVKINATITVAMRVERSMNPTSRPASNDELTVDTADGTRSSGISLAVPLSLRFPCAPRSGRQGPHSVSGTMVSRGQVTSGGELRVSIVDS